MVTIAFIIITKDTRTTLCCSQEYSISTFRGCSILAITDYVVISRKVDQIGPTLKLLHFSQVDFGELCRP